MRFLLYNIRYATGSGVSFHLPFPFFGYLRPNPDVLKKIAEFVGEYSPDIVGLVEVDAGSMRSGSVNQPEFIADYLGHYHVYECKYSPDSFFSLAPVTAQQGNAVLTGREILAQKFHYFQEGVKRLVIEIELEDCCIFLVHLSLSFRHRHRQLSFMRNLVTRVEKPVIVAGDFNCLSGESELELFCGATGLINANKDGQFSFPSHRPRKQLDFFLHSNHIEVNKFDIIKTRLSDHLPIVVDFEVCS